jgi:hypothetical protein
VELLEKLLGGEIKGVEGTKVRLEGSIGEPNSVDLGEDVDFNGLSLVELARSEQAETDDLHVCRPQTVEECMYPTTGIESHTYVLMPQMK